MGGCRSARHGWRPTPLTPSISPSPRSGSSSRVPVRRSAGRSISRHRRNRTCSILSTPHRASSGAFLVELAADEFGDGLDRDGSLRSGSGDDDGGSRRRREHHQPHDRGAADGLIAACHPDVGVEALHQLNEFRRGAGVKAPFVDDRKFPGNCAGGNTWARLVFRRGNFVVGHLPARTRLAMVTYLRPASWAMAIASGSERSSRTLASLTSIGRLIPASTSTFGRLMQEIARLEGVPPNMSVRIATPSPLSTRLTASMMSLRHRSESSSAP